MAQRFQDLGFGTKAVESGARLINRDGSFNIRRKGLPFYESFSLYHYLISIPWWQFIAFIVAGYVVINALFGAIYFAIGTQYMAGVDGHTPIEQYFESVFFSTQTFTTVGYGRVAPVGYATNVVAAIESLSGLLSFAFATGLLYGRFSRPVARIIFSKHALVAPYNGENGATTAFMFRVANQRVNQLIDVEATLNMVWLENVNGKMVRQFHELDLERRKVNFFHLSWTIVHPIDQNSPLWGIDKQRLDASDVEFLIILKGFDDAFAQTVHSRISYKGHEVVFSHKFSGIIRTTPDGMTEIDLGRIHEHEQVSI
jgi:inward rectifier potassium channel